MATTASLPPGAVTNNRDPFTTDPSHSHPAPLRYAPFDSTNFSLLSTSSPSSARRALEAHLKDTDRRIQEASKLGSTLVHQRKDLAARLKEVEQMQQDSDMPEDLREKLTELEKEYNEVGRESARAFLPKSRTPSEMGLEASTVISGTGRESPTKVSAPSRRQRNQPNNRVHDIEFATEISTSLLAQVRQLQAALAEKDEELKDSTATRAQLEAEADSLVQRIRHMDENEQKYKDENWNLETRLQEMESNLKQSMDQESRLAQTLKSTETEKAAKERELDDLKVTHDKLNESHAMAKKVQEADLHGLRRDAAGHETEKQRLQKKVDELTMQNTELAKAVSYRFNQAGQPSDTDFVSAEEGAQSDDHSPLPSEPASPIKGTPARHGVLETETLRSSLNHAHRMIQNLKNTIHREKTEKIELKRMLQDARDEVETRRETNGVAANVAKKRRSEPEGVKFKKSSNFGKLGAARSSTTEIIDEPDWEDQELEHTPSRAQSMGIAAASAGAGAAVGAAFSRSEEDTTDAFETANERDTTTESEAFATGNEDFDEDTEGDATETESGAKTNLRSINSLSSNPKDRRSFMSTASTSGDEDDDIVRTPVHNVQQKYKLRLGRGGRRSGRVGDVAADSPSLVSSYSPSSSTGTPQSLPMPSLGDELDALDDDSVEGTPSSSRMADFDTSESTPATQRQMSMESESPLGDRSEHTIVDPTGSPQLLATQTRSSEGDAVLARSDSSLPLQESSIQRPAMVDSGMMTEPWEPERIIEERIVEKIVEVQPEPNMVSEAAPAAAGGVLAGFGLGKLLGLGGEQTSTAQNAGDKYLPNNEVSREPATAMEILEATTKPVSVSVGTDAYPETQSLAPEKEGLSVPFSTSPILSQQTEPDLPATRTYVETGHDAWSLESTIPVASKESQLTPVMPEPEPVNLTFSAVVAQELEPIVAEPIIPLVPKRSSKRLDLAYAKDESRESELARDASETDGIPSTDRSKVGAGFFAGAVPNALPNDSQAPSRVALADMAPNAALSKPMSDEGSQTMVSGEDIDSMLRNKNVAAVPESSSYDNGSSSIRGAAVSGAATAAAVAAVTASSNRDNSSVETKQSAYESPFLKSTSRPTSAGSVRSKSAIDAPPLPPDHTQKIAAAQQAPGSSSGTMGPPLMPASAYKSRPRTPNERLVYERRGSREGTTPRAVRAKDSRTQLHSDRISHRTSVSSFASELDDRFNITRGQIMYPNDIEPATDPRMIQAITQTMIGEYLWKYTRKAGRSETSSTRHRRFFWVHPYTRTLYWSEQDPSTAGKNMLKAKSVAIDAVRVISDDNAYPPGLHRKSLVVVTPGREIVFTAPTGQRHETWFNALSYLLLRTEREKSEASDTIDQSDMDEFNPGIGRTVRESIGRMTGRSQSRQSRASLSSYNSRTTRTTSPQRPDADRTLTQRHGTGTITQRTLQTPAGNNGLSATVSNNSRVSSSSVAGRISSITSRFRPSSSHRARSSASLRGADDPAQIYDASVVVESAEDLRAVIEQQERDADRLENVRACCDGE